MAVCVMSYFFFFFFFFFFLFFFLFFFFLFFLLFFFFFFFCFVFFGSPFSIAITSLGEERANLSAFCTFVRFALVWFCLFPLPLGVWEGLWFVIVAVPEFFSYFFFCCAKSPISDKINNRDTSYSYVFKLSRP